jgi:stress-induced morphogen
MSVLKYCRKSLLSLHNSYLYKFQLKSDSQNIFINKIQRNFNTTSLLNGDDGFKKEYNEGEKKLINLLKNRFPNAKTIEVNDISGGCGSMYEIFVETNEFKNIRKVKQHQMINQVLQTEINNMHGLRIYTAASEAIENQK